MSTLQAYSSMDDENQAKPVVPRSPAKRPLTFFSEPQRLVLFALFSFRFWSSNR